MLCCLFDEGSFVKKSSLASVVLVEGVGATEANFDVDFSAEAERRGLTLEKKKAPNATNGATRKSAMMHVTQYVT